MPRAALGYSFGPVMFALMRWGIVPDRATQLHEAAKHLTESQRQLGLSIPSTSNPAKLAATALAGRSLCVYGTTGHTDVVALRLKCQFAENSKAAAFANNLPELNHNEIVGMDASADPERYAVVIVRNREEEPLAQKRLDWLTNRLSHRGIPVVVLSASGDTRMSRMLSLVQLGDYISYYLAIMTGHDPTPIPAIVALKSEFS